MALEPSFDCSKAGGSAEEAVCASDALASMDLELARLYSAAANGPNMTPERLSELKAMQRGWIKGRDECWKDGDGLESCVAAEYGMRIFDLRQGYSDARADEGASTGPFAYVCDGVEGAISAVFINTNDPMAVLHWGERVITMPQVPAASGVHYRGDWLGETANFWTKGDEASFAPSGEIGVGCVMDETG
ncbi:hypothetical protein GCM10011415_12770 [Salipiger pallidus]|uniref:Lysozyme inhibitor LprI N-terminal domain-containing protein n=1 Tax=Salipiger pallidus TaxID=1775170 RepID=A0A8J3EF15_9RHOB|nr:hypothetical protein GCM10011415_12770 [Salipiger pallidus]